MKQHKKTSSILALTCSAALLLCIPAAAQQVYEGNQTGLAPFGSFNAGKLDYVALTNGNLHIEIPILSVQQRGRTFSYRYIYDTRPWSIYWEPNPIPRSYPRGWWIVDGGVMGSADWRLVTPETSYSAINTIESKYCAGYGTYLVRTNWAVQGRDGTQHQAATKLSYQTACEPSQLVGPTLDGSGMILDITNWPSETTILTKDGTRANPYIRDSNGNLVSDDADMLGRDLLVVTNGPMVEYTSPQQRTAYGYEYTNWTVKNSNGDPQVFRIDYEAIDVHTSACNSPYAGGPSECIEFGPIAWVRPSKLTLPNGKFYEFHWQNDSFGELTEVVLPTGGSIEYEYTTLYFRPPNTSAFSTSTARQGVSSRTVSPGGTWSYTYPQLAGTTGTVTDPLGNEEVRTFEYLEDGSIYSASRYETEVKRYQGSSTSGTLMRTLQKTYAYETNPVTDRPEANVRLIEETATLESGQTTKVETDYETFQYPWGTLSYIATRLNALEKRQYDYGLGLMRRTDFTYLHTGNQAYLSRNIVNRIASRKVYEGGGVLKARTEFEYDNYTEPIQASGAVQHDPAFGPSFTTRGNLTATKRWRNTDGAWLITRHQYDDAGNIIKTTDPLGHTTEFSYADAWGEATCAPSGGAAAAYVTVIRNDLGHEVHNTYNSCTGTLASTTDPNSQTTTFSYDFMNRPDITTFPDDGEVDRDYDDSALWVMTRTLKEGASYIYTYTHFDGLGRVWREELCEDGSPACTQSIKTDTTYDALGRRASVSNPYRNVSEDTYGVTSFQYDTLNRVEVLTRQDGTTVTTSYWGNCSTTTDEAGKLRKSCTDALGRVTSVWEPDPVSGELVNETAYQYDALNNLICVVQKGTDTSGFVNCASAPASWRPRTFVYNSLSQLTTASNPESGTTTYTYDNDGNLLSKTDARGITISYTYDELHRLKTKDYSNTTSSPDLTTYYDQSSYTWVTITNGIGRRTGVLELKDGLPNETEAWSYDEMGRVVTDGRGTNGQGITFSYDYNEGGLLTTIYYPFGSRKVEYGYDAAGRALSAINPTIDWSFVLNATYAPHGALASFTQGVKGTYPGLTRTFSYNNRLQPLQITAATSSHTVLDLSYDFNLGTANNGNVMGITNNLSPGRSQTFTYDQLNRLDTAQSQATSGADCWGLDYGYDIWANLLSASLTKCFATPLSVTVDANNHINSGGFVYDTAGNLTNYSGSAYTYDAENRLASAGGYTYTYDGAGRRVKKTNGSSGTLYWYGLNGEVLEETTLTRGQVNEYIYFGGQRVTRRENGVGWFNYVADHLGSTRVLVMSGEYTPCYDADFLPYGEEKVYTNTCPQNYKFTGKERDAESGLDNFGARYYGSTLGRFLQIDPANVGALLPEPQTWNAYAYVGNNPLRFMDPLGLQKSDETPPQTAQDTCAQMQPRESGACTHLTEAKTGQNSGGCETASNDPCGQLVSVALYLSGDLSGSQIAQALGMVESAKFELATVGINLEVTPPQTLSFDQFLKGGGTEGALNLVFATDADMTGIGSGSTVQANGMTAIFINVNQKRDRIVQFEFVQALTLNPRTDTSSGNLFGRILQLGRNAIKDTLVVDPITNSLQGPRLSRTLTNILTLGSISKMKENAASF